MSPHCEVKQDIMSQIQSTYEPCSVSPHDAHMLAAYACSLHVALDEKNGDSRWPDKNRKEMPDGSDHRRMAEGAGGKTLERCRQ